MSTAFHPQTDGQTERANRTLEQMLRIYVNPAHSDWDTFLPLVEYAYNSARQESTEATPFEIIYGFTPIDPFFVGDFHIDYEPVHNRLNRMKEIQEGVSTHLQSAATRQKALLDPHRRAVKFQVGDQVLLSTKSLNISPCPKFQQEWIGPFNIIKVIGTVAYELDLPPTWKIHKVFHVSLLKPYHKPTLFSSHTVPVDVKDIVDLSIERVPERVLAETMMEGHKWYLVHWEDTLPLEDSWEPAETLEGTDALEAYNEELYNKKRPARQRVLPLRYR